MVQFGPPIITMKSTGRWMRVATPDLGWWMGQTEPTFPDILVRNFVIRRPTEGPQLILEWDAPNEPESATVIRIVRRLYDFPMHQNDGKILYEGPPEGGRYVDLDLIECKCWYYTIWTQRTSTGEWLASNLTSAAAIPIKSGHKLALSLIDLFPETYLLRDKKQDQVENGYLTITMAQDPVTGEWRNLYEDGKARGEFNRFLKNFGVELDYAKGLIDCLPAQFDVDETCCDNLQAIADILGISLNNEWSCSLMREEIKKEKYIQKWKGTELAFEAKARAISRLRADVVSTWRNIVCSNTIGRGSLDFSLAAAVKFGKYGDPNAYVIGSDHYQRLYILWLFLYEDSCVDQAIVEKLNRELPRYRPACVRHQIRFMDHTWEEQNREQEDDFWDEKEDSFEEFYAYTLWFKSNRVNSLSNSLTLTPGPGQVHLMDAWWDNIIPKGTDWFDEYYLYAKWVKASSTGSLSNTLTLTPGPGPSKIQENWWDV
jgi:hypothetical protein